MPFGIGPFELVIILVIILVIFGVGRLPEVGGAMGKAIREFRKAQADEEDSEHPPKAEGPSTDSR